MNARDDGAKDSSHLVFVTTKANAVTRRRRRTDCFLKRIPICFTRDFTVKCSRDSLRVDSFVRTTVPKTSAARSVLFSMCMGVCVALKNKHVKRRTVASFLLSLSIYYVFSCRACTVCAYFSSPTCYNISVIVLSVFFLHCTWKCTIRSSYIYRRTAVQRIGYYYYSQ